VICPCCGRDISSVQREIKLEFPEAVLQLSLDERKARVGVGGSAFMQLDLQHFFVRALLPVRLSDSHEFHFGVWLETTEEIAKRLWEIWDLPDYSEVRFAATLANAVPAWNEAVLGAPCFAEVRQLDQLPYVESSSHPALSAVLATPWARAECEQLLEQVWGPGDGLLKL
jgi:hypothetical protein